MSAVLLILLSAGCGSGTDQWIKAPGVVEGEIITMKSKTASSVKEILADEGQGVEPDEELVKFDSRIPENKRKDIELNLQSISLKLEKLNAKKELIQANRAYLKGQMGKFSRLSKKRSVSADDFEKIRLKYLEADNAAFDLNKSVEDLQVQQRILKNKKDYLDLLLEDYSIRSGVAGVVMERFISPGENVLPGLPIMDILDTNSLFVEIFVQEDELYAVRRGSEVRIQVDGVEDRELTGIVADIGRKAEFSPKYVVSESERKSLLYKVKISLKKDLDLFKIGMPVTVFISRGSR